MAFVRMTLLAVGVSAALTTGPVGSNGALLAQQSQRAPQAPAGFRFVAAEAGTAAATSFRRCRDARCTVTARVGDRLPIAHRFGFDRLTVREIGGGLIFLEALTRGGTVEVVGPYTSSNATCPGGTCTAGFSVGAGEVGRVNGVRVRALKVGGGRATIRLSVLR